MMAFKLDPDPTSPETSPIGRIRATKAEVEALLDIIEAGRAVSPARRVADHD
jgi:hypothetical protein